MATVSPPLSVARMSTARGTASWCLKASRENADEAGDAVALAEGAVEAQPLVEVLERARADLDLEVPRRLARVAPVVRMDEGRGVPREVDQVVLLEGARDVREGAREQVGVVVAERDRRPGSRRRARRPSRPSSSRSSGKARQSRHWKSG